MPRNEIPGHASRCSNILGGYPGTCPFGLYRRRTSIHVFLASQRWSESSIAVALHARLASLGTWRAEKPYTSQTRLLISTWALDYLAWKIICFSLHGQSLIRAVRRARYTGGVRPPSSYGGDRALLCYISLLCICHPLFHQYNLMNSDMMSCPIRHD